MALLSTIFKPGDLAKLSEAHLDILTAALDAEILQNVAVKKAVTAKLQALHANLQTETKKAK